MLFYSFTLTPTIMLKTSTKIVALAITCVFGMQEAYSQGTPYFNSNEVVGNQPQTGAFFVRSTPINVEGPYVELFNNGFSDAARRGSIGLISGYNAADANGLTHSFLTRKADGNYVYQLRVFQNGTVRIGSQLPFAAHADAKLAVDGKLVARSFFVTAQNWADYVFDEQYKLTPLSEVEAYVKQNKHLPEIPTTCEVEETGVDVSAMNTLLLKKVEELTLHLIKMDKRVKELEAGKE